MIPEIEKAMQVKYPGQASCRVFRNEADKEVVEFSVEIPRGEGKHPKTAAVIMNCAVLPKDCEARVLKQIEKTLSTQ